jgi:hypothetical protein
VHSGAAGKYPTTVAIEKWMDLVVRRWNIEDDVSYVKPRRQKMVGMIEAPTSADGNFSDMPRCPT